MNELPLLDEAFLKAQWHEEYAAFAAAPEAGRLERRLKAWGERDVLKETSSEAAFLQRFFVETWGYRLQGATDASDYTCRPQFEVARNAFLYRLFALIPEEIALVEGA